MHFAQQAKFVQKLVYSLSKFYSNWTTRGTCTNYLKTGALM